MSYSVFNSAANNSSYSKNFNGADRKCFFGVPFDVARYDVVKYPLVESLVEKQLGFFWRPQEVNLQKDASDFRSLTEGQQAIFSMNLARQIVLDSVQGRGPLAVLLPICTLPEIENWLGVWGMFEQIHSRSYTHIIRRVYADPSVFLDQLLSDGQIVQCAADISKYYDELMLINHDVNKYGSEQHKKALWLCLNSINALEGLRFYVSFACSWAFAEQKMMEGNAKIIKLIARDENLHLGATQVLLKGILPGEDPYFAHLDNDKQTREEVREIFAAVAHQEIAWANSLFQRGSVLGLSEEICQAYIQWLTNKRLSAIRHEPMFEIGRANPLPWTEKWIRGDTVQVAPQEVEVSSYVVGSFKQDVDLKSLTGFKL